MASSVTARAEPVGLPVQLGCSTPTDPTTHLQLRVRQQPPQQDAGGDEREARGGGGAVLQTHAAARRVRGLLGWGGEGARQVGTESVDVA